MRKERKRILIEGNAFGRACPQCGHDCWSVRYVEQPGGTICQCTCAVCLHYAKADARIVPQIVLTQRPAETVQIQL